jgi:hypothetical protein
VADEVVRIGVTGGESCRDVVLRFRGVDLIGLGVRRVLVVVVVVGVRLGVSSGNSCLRVRLVASCGFGIEALGVSLDGLGVLLLRVLRIVLSESGSAPERIAGMVI